MARNIPKKIILSSRSNNHQYRHQAIGNCYALCCFTRQPCVNRGVMQSPLPMIVFRSFSLMTRGVPLSKSPGNSWSSTGVGLDLVTCPSKENSDSCKDSFFLAKHQCFPLKRNKFVSLPIIMYTLTKPFDPHIS